MSQNNLPSNLPSVERLLQRVAVAEKSQQKEIRITIQEARDLTSELAIFSTKMSKTVQLYTSLLLPESYYIHIFFFSFFDTRHDKAILSQIYYSDF